MHYSEEAERGVLGAVLLDSAQTMDLCVERGVSEESFYVPAHKAVFGVFKSLHDSGKVVDLVTASAALRSSGKSEAIGGSIFLDNLVDATPTAAHAEHYIGIILDRQRVRAGLEFLTHATELFNDPAVSTKEKLLALETGVFRLTEERAAQDQNWKACVEKVARNLKTAYVDNIGKARQGTVPTGFARLDRIVQFSPGELIILAARPSVGKTALAMQIVDHAALNGIPTGVVSLEMSGDAIIMRMLCNASGANTSNLFSGFVSPRTIENTIMPAADALAKRPIVLDDRGGLDIAEVRSMARRWSRKNGVGLIMVDYLQLMQCKDKSRQGRVNEVSAISAGLKAMAKELRIPVLVLSQLSRFDKEGYRHPRLSDLRDSGSIEQDADVVMFLVRPSMDPRDDEYADKGLALLNIAKHRNGPTGEVRLDFTPESVRFSERPVSHEESEY